MSSLTCPICQHDVILLDANYPGYQEPQVYSIYKCQSCNTSVAYPLAVDNSIYDLIYKQADQLPGYYRYSQYAEKVLTETNPLDYLASKEEMYWGVKKCLEKIQKKTGKIENILEVGSGLGYLTYSLRKSGINSKGIDISEIAVNNANKKYGNFFLCEDIYNMDEYKEGNYDVIIMTEVIEHLPEPIKFITKLTKLLRTGGELFITTPNKSYFDSSATWETDAPPIHLWWFSKESIEHIATEVGCTPHFILMKDYKDDPNVIEFIQGKIPTPKNQKQHMLDNEGHLSGNDSIRMNVIIFMSKYGFLTLIRKIKNTLLSWIGQTNSYTEGEDKIICVSLVKQENHDNVL